MKTKKDTLKKSRGARSINISFFKRLYQLIPKFIYKLYPNMYEGIRNTFSCNKKHLECTVLSNYLPVLNTTCNSSEIALILDK